MRVQDTAATASAEALDAYVRASTERFASNGGGSTDERNNNPPAQAHASPFWRVVLREPSAVRARVRE